MNLRIVTLFVVALLLIGCGSKKRTTRNNTSKTTIEKEVVETPKKEDVTVVAPKKYLDVKLKYIDTYSDIAMREMQKYKIPASITLAQGILESSSGQSDLTSKSNNHFGIKCHKGWTGGRTYHDDDEKGECFRVYDHPESSFRDHSLFLAERTRYAGLFDLRITDYKGWAKGLKKAGYATDKAYPQKLITIIEQYELYEYDDLVLGKNTKRKKKKETDKEDYHIVKKGDTLYSISRKYGLTVDSLKSINGLDSNTISIDQKIFVSN